jgi:hypothetical protein
MKTTSTVGYNTQQNYHSKKDGAIKSSTISRNETNI